LHIFEKVVPYTRLRPSINIIRALDELDLTSRELLQENLILLCTESNGVAQKPYNLRPVSTFVEDGVTGADPGG
jgi:hypothetical protein